MAYRTATPPEKLGPLVRAFAWAHTPKMIAIGVFFFLPLLVPVFAPWGENWNAMSYLGAALMLVGMPAMGAYILRTAYRQRKNYVRIHELGLEYRWQDLERTVLFEDVTEIQSRIEQKITNGIPGPVTHQHKIRLSGGEALGITHGFADVGELVGELRERTRGIVLERARASFAEGRTVKMGPLTLGNGEVRVGTLRLPVSEVRRVEVAGGAISIFTESARPWVEVPYADVPNAHLLEALLRIC